MTPDDPSTWHFVICKYNSAEDSIEVDWSGLPPALAREVIRMAYEVVWGGAMQEMDE